MHSQMNGRGYLKLYLGPMFAGKTSAIVQNYRSYIRAKKRVLVVNHAFDTRYSESNLSTHDGIEIPCVFATELSHVTEMIREDYDVILINEGQFFPDIYDTSLLWTEQLSKMVYVCALDGDSNREPFGDILRLIPCADTYEKLTSICENCGSNAPFTYRDPALSNGEKIQIGVSEFRPLCRGCFLDATERTKTETKVDTKRNTENQSQNN